MDLMPAANNSGILNELSQERKDKVLGGETNFRVENSTAVNEEGQRTIAEPEPVRATPAPNSPTVEEAKATPKQAPAATPAAKAAPPKASTKA